MVVQAFGYPQFLKLMLILPRSRALLGSTIVLEVLVAFAAWVVMSRAHGPAWVKIVMLAFVGMLLLQELDTLLIRPWLSLPKQIRVSSQGVELFAGARPYAVIGGDQIAAIRQERYPPGFRYFGVLFGEVTEVRCNGPVPRFYLLPCLVGYSAAIERLYALAGQELPVATTTSFPVNRLAIAFPVGVLVLMLVGLAILASPPEPAPKWMPLYLAAMAMLVVLGIFRILLTTPLSVDISPDGVSLRYLTHTRAIARTDLRGTVTLDERWSGDYRRALSYATGKVVLPRVYYDRYEEMVRALQHLAATESSAP